MLRIDATNNAPVGSIFTSTNIQNALDLRANQQFAGLTASGNVVRGTAGTSTLTLSRNDGTSSTSTGSINGGATNIVNLVKSGNYTQIMGGNASSTSAGSTTVNAGILALSKTDGLDALGTGAVEVTGGTLRLDNNNQLAGSQNMILSGGTFALNGFDDSLGSISLTNSTSSILDFGSGGSTVLFSEFATGSGLLSVTTWDLLTGSFRVTSDPTAFLSQITFNGTGATSVNQGRYYEIRAVPFYTSPTYAGGTGIWSTGFTPTVTNSANAVFFGTGGTATNDIALATLSSIGTLTFDGTNSYTLEANSGSAGFNSASALAIGGTILNNSLTVQTINLATSFAANQTINANTGGIVMSGNMAVASGATLTVVGSMNTALSGVVSGLGGLTKNSSSTLTLSGNNSYSGTTTVTAGVLNIKHANALGETTGSTTVSNAAALELQGGITVGAEALSLTGTGVSNNGALRNISGSNTYGGAITLAGATRINSDADLLTLSGGISGAQNLTIGGSGNTTISNAIATSTGRLTKDGLGTLTLSAANTYTGATTINAGTLSIAAITNGGVAGALGNSTNAEGNLTLGGGTLEYTGSTSNSTDRNFTLTAGTSSAISVSNSAGSLTISGVAINTTGNLTKSGAGTLILTRANLYTGTTTISAGTLQIGAGGTSGSLSSASVINNNGTLVFNRSDTMTQGTAFTSTIGGTGNLIQAGTGTLVLSGVNTYTGSTTVSAGNLTISNASALGGTGSGTTVANGASLQIQGDIAVGAEALTLTGSGFSSSGALRNLSGANSLTGAITLSGATTIGSDAGTLTLSGGISGTQNLTFTGAGNTTISGAIATSTGTLTKNGSGTTTLNAANTYTGTTTVNSGTLTAATANALGNSTVIDVNGGSFLVTAENAVNDNAAINLNGGRMAVSGTFNENVGLLTLSANSVIDFSAFVGTLRFSGVSSWAPSANLAIWNWSGTTYWGTQVNNYATPSNLVFSNNSTLTSNLANISFYSDSGNSFVGSGFEVSGFSGGGSQIIAVPEPETYLTGILLILGATIYQLRLARQGRGFLSRLRSHLQKTHRKPLGGSTSGLTQISSTEGISRQN